MPLITACTARSRIAACASPDSDRRSFRDTVTFYQNTVTHLLAGVIAVNGEHDPVADAKRVGLSVAAPGGIVLDLDTRVAEQQWTPEQHAAAHRIRSAGLGLMRSNLSQTIRPKTVDKRGSDGLLAQMTVTAGCDRGDRSDRGLMWHETR
jgi:hypothetical protein